VSQKRVDINAEMVKNAIAAASPGSDVINDWNDKTQSYLTLRQRGPSVRWLVRAYRTSRTIGSAVNERGGHGYLNIADARKKAAIVYGSLASGDQAPQPRLPPTPEVKVWTWADLDREYQALISKPRWINRRRKLPVKGTMDDVRLAFARPSYEALHQKLLTELNRRLLNGARDAIVSKDPDKGVHRQREKCVAYFKAAMTWAAGNKPDESGLTEDVDRWWERLNAGEPADKEMVAIEQRAKALLQAKSDLTVDHVAEVLLQHESYCAGRIAEDKISPGIRWGLWWVCHTANRRFSTVKLRRADFMASDEFAQPGWGRAMWPGEMMKAKNAFWLPLPPETALLAVSSMKDWRVLVNKSHGHHHNSSWVFASTRRIGRLDDNPDVSVYPNSLNRHLQRMKDSGLLKKKDVQRFGLHLVRSVAGTFLDNCNGIPPVAASLMLAHTLPKGDDDEAAETTREFYLTSQRMDLKASAMTAWTEALMNAYIKRGGKPPIPSET
jgi:hypothetical protein